MTVKPTPRNISTIRPVHPFPARMAPSIVEEILGKRTGRLRVLDPMAGSGTTLALARYYGHKAIGLDSDPLAVLISRTWCADLDSSLLNIAERALYRAKQLNRHLAVSEVLENFDEETAAFIRFWYDPTNTKQLWSLATAISRCRAGAAKLAMWTALSRLIVTKESGASRGIDVSHSRPHRAYAACPVRPFESFLQSVQTVLTRSPFSDPSKSLPRAQIERGDARRLPFAKDSADLVITSPPYLNAIDYLRGHKLSLIWMGHSIRSLRQLRASNVGSENVTQWKESKTGKDVICAAVGAANLPRRTLSLLGQYAVDMDLVLHEIRRVLVSKGTLVMVVGNSTLKGQFIQNSNLIKVLASQQGFALRTETHREIPASRRYLPPPGKRGSGAQFDTRMREEVVLTFGG
jgi:DNA modification methylase